MRYCENCKRFTGTHMTSGQIAVATALLVTVIGFILYIIFHERKCNHCDAPTVKVKTIKGIPEYEERLKKLKSK